MGTYNIIYKSYIRLPPLMGEGVSHRITHCCGEGVPPGGFSSSPLSPSLSQILSFIPLSPRSRLESWTR